MSELTTTIRHAQSTQLPATNDKIDDDKVARDSVFDYANVEERIGRTMC